jgi:hypothetical protein
MALEEELRAAIALRNEMAVDLAVCLLQLTVDTGAGPLRFADHGIVGGKLANVLTGLEALTAVILQRCGMSWDSMAARVDMTRQALHRRLSDRGEELFDAAVDGLMFRDLDGDAFVAELRAATQAGEVPRLPVSPEDIRDALLSIPPEEEIVSAPDDLVAWLVELRRIPEWWKREW